jgi:hypothetical protein
MSFNRTLSVLLFASIFTHLTAQKYAINATHDTTKLKPSAFKMGNPGPKGSELNLNCRYMSRGSSPILPVMGEVHYSRVDRNEWESTILKMKACGVNIVAFYVIWNHHEEIESQFEWTGNKDLRNFIQLIKKHGMMAYPRIGPWAHGEVRHGGTPDWIMKKTIMEDRSNHPVYQYYADRFFAQMGKQMDGLYYKDGGPIIGIQLENEYWFGEKGEEHIKWIKASAQKHGMDVPMYTVTGWGDCSIPKNEVIPLWGGYPDAPWAPDLKISTKTSVFSFVNERNDSTIGNDQNIQKKRTNFSIYPYFTCELGVGNQNTYHRRHIISPIDGLGLVVSKLGSGSNLIGYYMFAGGTNPIGNITSLEEEQDESSYYTTVPIRSYDFQAAIRETGEINGSYKEIKKIHYFLNQYGDILSPMNTFIGKTGDNDIQMSYRYNGKSGFLFALNYHRNVPRPTQHDVQFTVHHQSETITFPSKGITIIDSTIFIWPINMSIGCNQLKYATAQPICNIGNTYFFSKTNAISAEFCFDDESIQSLESKNGTVERNKGKYIVSNLKTGLNNAMTIHSKNGEITNIVFLSDEDSKNLWVFKNDNKTELYISQATLLPNQGTLEVLSNKSSIIISKFGQETRKNKNFDLKEINTTDSFYTYKIDVPSRNIALSFNPKHLLDDAMWIYTNEKDSIKPADILMKHYIMKEFSLTNPSKIKSAKLYIAPETGCRININNTWLTESTIPNQLNTIDMAGYLEHGENKLILEFPIDKGKKAFAAKLIVEYQTSDKFELSTNNGWMGRMDYMRPTAYNPTHYARFGQLEPVKIAPKPTIFENIQFNSFSEYTVNIPENLMDGINQAYLHIDYIGNTAQIYHQHKLLADDFYNGTTWNVALNRLDHKVAGKEIRILINPLLKSDLILFDKNINQHQYNQSTIEKISLTPEYKVVLKQASY